MERGLMCDDVGFGPPHFYLSISTCITIYLDGERPYV